MALSQHVLSKGWSFKDSEGPDAWMPVPVVPSVVHQDLLANKKYAHMSIRVLLMLMIFFFLLELKTPLSASMN